MPACRHLHTIFHDARPAFSGLEFMLDEKTRKATAGERWLTETCRVCHRWRSLSVNPRAEGGYSATKGEWHDPTPEDKPLPDPRKLIPL